MRDTKLRLDLLGTLLLTFAVGPPLSGLELLTELGESAYRLWGMGLIVLGVGAAALRSHLKVRPET